MDWRNETEALTLKGQIKIPYTWSVGETGSRFLVALRDEQKILANRCPQCGYELVAWAVREAEVMGREPATPDEARVILGTVINCGFLCV